MVAAPNTPTRTTRKTTSPGTVVDLFRKVEPVDVPGKQPGRVAQLSQEQARILTTNIKHAVVRLWVLVAEAHDRGAFTALGYETWREYVVGELQMSESTSYNYLDQARIMRELVSAGVDPNEVEPPPVRVVQRIKDNLTGVRKAAKRALADGVSVEDALKELADDMTPRSPRGPGGSGRVIQGRVEPPGEPTPPPEEPGSGPALGLTAVPEPPAGRSVPPVPQVDFSAAEQRVEAVKAEITRGQVICPACEGVGHVPRKIAKVIGPVLKELQA